MNAQPGWYDAGVPGVQRWWDGAQWSAHERALTQQPIPLQQANPPHPTAAQYVAPVAMAAPMGWYPVVGTSDVRWWDGTGWTPYRLRDGKPRPDVFAIEPQSNGLVLGFLFIALGFMQFGNYNLSGQPFFGITPVLFFVSGVIWLVGGFRAGRLRKLPAPGTVPVFDPSTRPLPGEVESVGAGWYSVSGQVVRWWTGTQWSQYVGQKLGVRPTHFGARGYRVSMIIGWSFAVLGAIGTVLGFVLIYALDRWVGVAIVIPGMIGVVVGGIVLPMTYIRRYTMILPPTAPPLH